MKEVFNSLGATGFNITRNTCIAEPREALGGGGGIGENWSKCTGVI